MNKIADKHELNVYFKVIFSISKQYQPAISLNHFAGL